MPGNSRYKKLLESLFDKGLSPSSQSVVDGLSKFFGDSRSEALSRRGTSNISIARSIGDSLVECLDSPSYRVVELSARILRDYVNSIFEIPHGCIKKLIVTLDLTVPSSAKQAALTLGCIACTKPAIDFRPPSMPLVDYVVMEPCWHCPGGYSRGKYARRVVPALIRNLDRPLSRDRKRVVRRACATALGEIGYAVPSGILAALGPLRESLKERNGMDAAIFALGCVGYSRPDLVGDLIPIFQEFSRISDPFIASACTTALKKIGVEIGCLLDYALKGKRTVSETMGILYEQMKEYESRLVDRSIDVIEALATKYPRETVRCLNHKLDEVHKEHKWTGHVDQNVVIAIRKLSRRLSHEMKETVPLLLEHFVKGPFAWYRTLDSSAIALMNIFEEHPEFIPENTEQELNSFLRNEGRGSVVLNTKKLLNVIMKHKKR
nr:hypothetical protein [Candidatus Njordarchaeota archaeon]